MKNTTHKFTLFKAKSGFTIVELIVVITILAILGTIGFISYTTFITDARDANRGEQIMAIYNGLDIYKKSGQVPLPDDYVTVYASGVIFGYQGYAGKNVLSSIGYEKGGLDPKDKLYLTYMTDKKMKNVELMVFMEGEESEEATEIGLIPKTFALDYTDRIPYVMGKKIGILTESITNSPIQENNELKSNGLDVVTTTGSYTIYFSNSSYITGTGQTLTLAINFINMGGGTSCNDILAKKPDKINQNGDYYINPTGTGIFEVYCDMTTDGGGWTLIATTADDGVNTWTYNNRNYLWNDSTFGDLSNINKDFKSQAYSSLVFQNMLFKDNQGLWASYNINSAGKTVKDFVPQSLDCAYTSGRYFNMINGNLPTPVLDTTGKRRDNNIYFSIKDNEDGACHNNNDAYGPTWAYKNNNDGGADDPSAFSFGVGRSGVPDNECGNARLGDKVFTEYETNDGDYIQWFVK